MNKNLTLLIISICLIFTGAGCETLKPGIESFLGLNTYRFVLRELDSEQTAPEPTATPKPTEREYFLNIVRIEPSSGASVKFIYFETGGFIKGLKPGLKGEIYNGLNWIGECELTKFHNTKGEARVVNCTNKIDSKTGKVKFTLTN